MASSLLERKKGKKIRCQEFEKEKEVQRFLQTILGEEKRKKKRRGRAKRGGKKALNKWPEKKDPFNIQRQEGNTS